MMDKKRLPRLCTDRDCTGCSECFAACPTGAITMPPSAEGFYRPAVDPDKCIRCLKCERTCPIITPVVPPEKEREQEVWAAWHNDPGIRRGSSSGGAFSALAQAVIARGGVVYGAAFDDDMTIRHIRVTDEAGLARLRLSKYAQSSVADAMPGLLADLKSGTQVLFCGTPCQCGGLRAMFGTGRFPNLILVDFICHGVPSPMMLGAYRKWLEERIGKRVERINFRDKRKGWYDALRVASGESWNKSLKGENDNYWVAFNGNMNLQEACYSCSFLGTERRTDITIADFWGLGKQKPFSPKNEVEKGVSAIIVTTSSGKALLEDAGRYLTMSLRSIDELKVGNAAMIRPSSRPACRDTFYPDLAAMAYPEVAEKYMRLPLKAKLVKLFRERFPSWCVEAVRNLGQK